MKIGPKYKIARRLKAPVFEKTQSQKFVLSESRKGGEKKGKKGKKGSTTDYGRQLLEKQKARYSYLLMERQFGNYVEAAMARKGVKNADALFENLETRLDNVVLRLGLSPTRGGARQLVSHGHIFVNGKRVSRPSYRVSIGDVIKIRDLSLGKAVFASLDERLKTLTAPAWLVLDAGKKEGKVIAMPKLEGANLLFDMKSVLEFYSR
jgi:small subunit ribosomal protein S4